MTGIVARIARWGFAFLFGALLATAVTSEASARHRTAHLHAHRHAHHAVARRYAEPVSPQPVRLGAMRYYGGPKSPMWRGPAEDETSHARAQASAQPALFSRQQPTQLGPMRYYGGPKSPMWRGPVEN
jgi:hypothetical protein